MADTVDLSGSIKLAIDGAYERGHPVTIAYVDGDGKPSLSIRGSALVLNSKELGIWARKPDQGLAKEIAGNPNVSAIFFGELPDGSKMMVTLQGRAHIDRARDREVYDHMSDIERKYDPEVKGMAVIIDIDSVSGMTADGPFKQSREAA